MNWINLVHGSDQAMAFVNTVINFQVTKTQQIFG
jgi:hypothetical protein